MHKDDAAYLFSILGDGNKVKVCKMLYVKGKLSFTQLCFIMDMSEEELQTTLKPLLDNNIILFDDSSSCFNINKEVIDELMNFISTPCGCTHK